MYSLTWLMDKCAGNLCFRQYPDVIPFPLESFKVSNQPNLRPRFHSKLRMGVLKLQDTTRLGKSNMLRSEPSCDPQMVHPPKDINKNTLFMFGSWECCLCIRSYANKGINAQILPSRNECKRTQEKIRVYVQMDSQYYARDQLLSIAIL